MSYKQMYKDMKKANQVQKLDTDYVKFTKEGQSVLGCLVATIPTKGKMNKGQYNQYLFETDDGPIKCAFGAAFDKQTLPLLHFGGVYNITYKGKEDIGAGQKVNRFEVLELSTTASDQFEEGEGE